MNNLNITIDAFKKPNIPINSELYQSQFGHETQYKACEKNNKNPNNEETQYTLTIKSKITTSFIDKMRSY